MPNIERYLGIWQTLMKLSHSSTHSRTQR
jgi:hypothetical protein